MPTAESPCFKIDRIELNGDSERQFQWSLAHAVLAADGQPDLTLPHCLGGQGINLMMRRVQNAIIAEGYITTRVLAGPQDLTSGILKLTLVPGVIRSVRLSETSDPDARYWTALAAGPGDLLNLRDLEQALENFRRLPTVDVDIEIQPAAGPNAQPGESDLVIDWQQRFPIRLTLGADDSGSDATGKYQGNATLSLDHWLPLNDMFYLSLNQDLGGGDPGRRGTRGHTLHYSVPFGYWMLGLTNSESRYHQSVAGIHQNYLYSGESDNREVKLSRLIYRDAARKTTLALRGWTRESSNFIDDTEIEIQRRRTAGWGAEATHLEHLGRTTLSATLGYRRGTGAKDALPAPEEATGEGSSHAKIITADTQVNVPFSVGPVALNFTNAVRAQWNRTPLVPQDRFAIGGRYTVRGFDGESLLSADRGWLMRNDLGWQPGGFGQELYLGVDTGEVSGPSRALLVGSRLSGAVMGLRGHYQALAYDVFAGKPLHQPEHFETDAHTAGFNLSFSW